MTQGILLGHGLTSDVYLRPEYANRHGLIAGITGSGKTTTLETMALGFSKIGVPCFVADVKGDISEVLRSSGAPVRMLDVFGEHGDRLFISVQRIGPELLSRMLGLSDVQSGVLEVAFAHAEKRNWPLRSLEDLQAELHEVIDNRASVSRNLGLVGAASVAAIERSLLRVDREGAKDLFRAPTFDVATLENPSMNGGKIPTTAAEIRADGRISILHAVRLMRSPTLYTAVLLFILQDLYDRLPEVGDLPQPRLVLFLDESHLLFQDCPSPMLQKIERIVRLIRSKGVALFFCTQSPADIPANILGQLGNRIQHGLRGATPADMRSIRAAADTLPVSATVNAYEEIGLLGVGEALVSVIGGNGIPQPVDRVKIQGPVTGETIAVGAGSNGMSGGPGGGGSVTVNPATGEEWTPEEITAAFQKISDASQKTADGFSAVAAASARLSSRPSWLAPAILAVLIVLAIVGLLALSGVRWPVGAAVAILFGAYFALRGRMLRGGF